MRIEWMELYMADAEKLIYENRLAEGLELLNSLLYDEPGYGRLHNHLGWAYFYYTADVASAELHFKMAIRFDAGYAAPYQHMGNLCIRTGRYDEALHYLELGLKNQGANRAAILESVAQAYELKREYGKAVKNYKEALASAIGFESEKLNEGIKRCRKKRWVMLFVF